MSGKGGITLLDEIYLGLSYDETFGHTGLALDDQVISINSFSKYFNMTGWRLGWMVVPEALVPVIERLAQNLFICPSAVAQHAALACFEPESLAEYERRRAQFKARRDWFIPQLDAMGLTVPVAPDGAFYAWADCSRACERLGVKDSWDFAFEVMRRAHVAVTPGRDFGSAADPQVRPVFHRQLHGPVAGSRGAPDGAARMTATVRADLAAACAAPGEPVFGRPRANRPSPCRSASTGKTPMRAASSSTPTT